MLVDFTLSELWKMEYPLKPYYCPICGAGGDADDFYKVTHAAWCALGKAIAIAKLKEEKAK